MYRMDGGTMSCRLGDTLFVTEPRPELQIPIASGWLIKLSCDPLLKGENEPH